MISKERTPALAGVGGSESSLAGKLDYRKCTSRHRRSQANRIDFDGINHAALASSIVSCLLPGGRLRGIEYIVRNPTRADRKPGSFCINRRTGKWADFATGDAGGDIVSLFAYLNGITQGEAARELADMLGMPMRHGPRPALRRGPTPCDRRTPGLSAEDGDKGVRQALTTFAETIPLPGTLAETYLIRRVRQRLNWCPDLRFHANCHGRFGADHRLEQHPALVALLRDIHTNEPRAIHRTFLKSDGSHRLRDEWGSGDEGKKARGPMRGCVLKLSPDDTVTGGLCLAEGIETGLSLLAKNVAPMWVTIGTSGMKYFPVLSGIEALTIFADRDTNGAGAKAARECAERWSDAGKEVLIWTPDATNADWNDVLGGGV